MSARAVMTGICIVALAGAVATSVYVDDEEESSGRSSLARAAQGFAAALEKRSADFLNHVAPSERMDPSLRAEVKELTRQIPMGAELLVVSVAVDAGGKKGTSEIEVLKSSARGQVSIGHLTSEWVRADDGTWGAVVLDK